MLEKDPLKRLTAEELLSHPFIKFDAIWGSSIIYYNIADSHEHTKLNIYDEPNIFSFRVLTLLLKLPTLYNSDFTAANELLRIPCSASAMTSLTSENPLLSKCRDFTHFWVSLAQQVPWLHALLSIPWSASAVTSLTSEYPLLSKCRDFTHFWVSLDQPVL